MGKGRNRGERPTSGERYKGRKEKHWGWGAEKEAERQMREK